MMAFDDHYRFSAHAVICNTAGAILQVKATYAGLRWGLPGGTIDPGETVHEALWRECHEELGVDVKILYMSGLYYHKAYNSQVCIFRAEMPEDAQITLSEEHSDYRYFPLSELTPIQRQRVDDCLHFDGQVKSAAF